MKKLVMLLTCFAFFGVALAQNSSAPTPDPRIWEAFDKATVEHLIETSPRTIEYYNFFLDQSYTIAEIPQEKVKDLEEMERLTLRNPAVGEMPDFSPAGLEKLNVLRFKININPVSGAIYRLGNTNKIIMFHPGNEITNKFKEYLNR